MTEPIESLTISGYTPFWMDKSKIYSIKGNVHGNKWKDVFNNAYLLAQDDSMPDNFVVMNDDFFILKNGFMPQMQSRCSFDTHLRKIRPTSRNGEWGRSLKCTYQFLAELGIEHPMSFELHTPFPVNKDCLLTIMDICSGWQGEMPPQWRSVYGNMYHHNAPMQGDRKIYRYPPRKADADWTKRDMVSTNGDGVTKKIMHILTDIHPAPSPWELY
jgi:hypothetical protein